MKQVDFIQELEERILPFWLNLLDKECGGFYGVVDYHLNLHRDAPKGGVLGARLLWTFSSAYLFNPKKEYLKAAHHAFDFLKNKLWDAEHGGIYWLVDYKGNPVISSKHIYAQSFALYGLSEYYRATECEEAMSLAKTIFTKLEETCYFPASRGYFEEFTCDWQRKEHVLLNEGVDAAFTTNSHLHLIEAYTNLYRIWPDEKLLQRIYQLLELFYEKIFHPKEHYCQVAFDQDWNSLKNTYSYGHDIETSWLLTETLELTNLNLPPIAEMNRQMAEKVAAEGIADDGSILDAKVNGVVHPTRVWWGQAEAVVGFYNAYEMTGDVKYLRISENVWKYIQEYMLDGRPGGEWLSRMDEEGEAISSLRSSKYTTPENIVDSWKCPYHNARMCLEMIRRLGN